MNNRIKNKIRLAKNLLALSVLVIGTLLIWRACSGSKKPDFQIDNTPIHVESIRTIAEIGMVSYMDQVVVDTVEYFTGKLNLYNPLEWQRLYQRNIKRRLTLIVEGEVRFGLDLTKSSLKQKVRNDTIILYLPKPTILDVIVTPSRTEVFQEIGSWDDFARVKLELKAKKQIQKNAEEMDLDNLARKNVSALFHRLIPDKRKLVIRYE